MEVWKPIQGYEGLYEVSNMGRVRSFKRISKGNKNAKILSPRKCGRNGKYLSVILFNGEKSKTFQIHRLVAMTFISNSDNKLQVDHINRNTQDNRVTNLRWVNQSENQYNTSRNRLVCYKGKTKPIGQWANELGIKYFTLRSRLCNGWDIAKAFETPIKKNVKEN